MNQEPTDAEKQWLWEQCGFTQTTGSYHYKFTEKVGDWLRPDGTLSYDSSRHKGHLPPIDLNNLFKYAVPKLKPKTLMMETYEDGYDFCVLSEKQSGGLWNGNDKDPALALFWAIYKALGGKE